MEEPNDGFNDWEQIQSPSAAGSPTTTQSRGHDDGAAVPIIDDYIPDNSSVFHPSNHEGLPICPPPQGNPRTRQTQSFSSDSNSNEGDEEVGPIGRRFGSGLGVLSSWVVRVGYWVRNCGGRGGGFWSFVCVTGVLSAALLVYGKVRRWRRRLFLRRENEECLKLLLSDKDKQISQLLLQIAQMNEILSAQRTVPVIRVGPFIVSCS